VQVSHDGGATWDTIDQGLIVTETSSVATSASGSTIYTGICGGGVADFETG
jgi:hypothetical protein